MIRCTQCQQPVTVPIPEGMAIEDFDATPEELSSQLLNTRKGLARAQKRLAEIEAEVAKLRAYQEETLRLAREREAAAEEFRLDLARALKEQETALASLRKTAESAAAALALPPS